MCVGAAKSIRDLHRDVICVVRACIRWHLEVAARCEGQHASRCVDREQGCVSSADNGEAQACPCVDIGGCDERNTRAVFRQGQCCTCAPTIRGDDGGFVLVCDGDGEALAVDTAGTVRHLHDDIVGIVGTDIGRRFEVGSRCEGQRSGRRVYGEPASIGPACDRVSQRSRGIGISGRQCRDGWRVLLKRDDGACAAAARGDDRRLVLVGDGDGNGLCVGAASAIRDLHEHIVDVVASGIACDVEVGRRNEDQRACRAVDGELRSIGPADDRVGQRCRGIKVGCRNGGNGRQVLLQRDGCTCAPTVRGDDGGLVLVGDSDGEALAVHTADAVQNLHDDIIDVVVSCIAWCLEVGCRDEGEHSGV